MSTDSALTADLLCMLLCSLDIVEFLSKVSCAVKQHPTLCTLVWLQHSTTMMHMVRILLSVRHLLNCGDVLLQDYRKS